MSSQDAIAALAATKEPIPAELREAAWMVRQKFDWRGWLVVRRWR